MSSGHMHALQGGLEMYVLCYKLILHPVKVLMTETSVTHVNFQCTGSWAVHSPVNV